MVSGCSTLSAFTQNCHVLIHFADDLGAFLETNLSPMLAIMVPSLTQGWSLGLLSRGGVATPDFRSPAPLPEGCPRATRQL